MLIATVSGEEIGICAPVLVHPDASAAAFNSRRLSRSSRITFKFRLGVGLWVKFGFLAKTFVDQCDMAPRAGFEPAVNRLTAVLPNRAIPFLRVHAVRAA